MCLNGLSDGEINKADDTVSMTGRYIEKVCSTLQKQWPVEGKGTVEEKWNTLKSALTLSAASTLGFKDKKHPDWFRENCSTLEPHRN